jgi:hypothetical protein
MQLVTRNAKMLLVMSNKLVSRNFMLMLKKMDLLNRVPEHDCTIIFSCYTEWNVNHAFQTGDFFRLQKGGGVYPLAMDSSKQHYLNWTPQVIVYIHMHLFTTNCHYFIFCYMHAYILYLIHEHFIWTQYSEQPPNILILDSCDSCGTLWCNQVYEFRVKGHLHKPRWGFITLIVHFSYLQI